nr:hypothetical protein [Tanacetum cinerariifolium]
MTSHLNAVKKIFKYLKGQPNLGNPQLGDAHFWGGGWIQGRVKSKQLWPPPLLKLNMLLLPVAVVSLHWDAQSLGTRIEGRNKPKGRLTIASNAAGSTSVPTGGTGSC